MGQLDELEFLAAIASTLWCSGHDKYIICQIKEERPYFYIIYIWFNLVRLWNHARIRSWNQPVVSNKSKVSCSRKQRCPLMGPTTSNLQVRRTTHCATPPRNIKLKMKMIYMYITHAILLKSNMKTYMIECKKTVNQ